MGVGKPLIWHAKNQVIATLLLVALICLSFYQLRGVFYRNLGAIELVHVIGANRLEYVADVASVCDFDLTQAADYLYQSFVWNPESTSTLRLTAMVAAAQGDWGQVVRMGRLVTQHNPSDTMGNLLLGYAYWHTGRESDAIRTWRRAKAAGFLYDRASLFQRDGKTTQAFELYALARQVDPYVSPRTESRVEIVWALYFAGRRDEARTELQAALADPHQEDWQRFIARGEMGMYYLREGQWQDAVKYYRLALGSGPRATPYGVWLGRAYMELGELDLAEEELWRTVHDAAANSTRAEAYFFLGRLYASRGQIDQSVCAYAEAVKSSRDNIEYHLYLARAYSSANQPEQALVEWEAIVSMRPDDPQIRAWYEQAKQQARP